MDSLFAFFQQWFFYAPTNPLFLMELLGFVTGIVAVYLVARENIWGWPIGIINCVVYIYVYWSHQFISDSILFVYFLLMQFYGWWVWSRRDAQAEGGAIVVLRMPLDRQMIWLACGTVGIFVWALGMKAWVAPALGTELALPWHDAATTVASLIAQYLMARRYIECWLIWIAVDILAPLNYLEKGLYPTAVLFLVYLVLASVGYITWKRTLDRQRAEAAA